MKRLLIFSSFSLCACSAPLGTSSSAIVNGATDTTDTSVVALHIASSNGPQDDALCSGTVVSPHVVMTAAHCLSPDVVGPVDHVDIFLGDDPFDPQEANDTSLFITAASTSYDPDFSKDAATHDIAVIVSPTPLALTPIALNHDGLGSGDINTPVHVVGFGESDGNDPSTAGPRRSADTVIFGVDDEHIRLVNVICEGDSGGPSIITKNGNTVVAGVHSFTTTPNCTSDGDDTRVDKYASFVDDAIDQADPGFLPGGCNSSGGRTKNVDAVAIVFAIAALARKKKSG
ncbi:MAG TPA: trypsin-like serine protease [Polyangiaceae bacterium]|nr:trypsin-like serine protease [Polyangiaceae bacterium]